MILKYVVYVAFCVILPVPAAIATDPVSPAQQLQGLLASPNSGGVPSALRQLSENAELSLDNRQRDQVLDIINNETLSDDVRIAAFHLAGRKFCRDDIKFMVVKHVPEWTNDVSQQWSNYLTKRTPTTFLPSLFLAEYFNGVVCAPDRGWTDDVDTLCTTVSRVLTGEAPINLKLASSDLTMASVLRRMPIDSERKSSIIVEALDRKCDALGALDDGIFQFLTKAGIDRLRPRLLNVPDDPREYCIKIATALSHHGDIESVPLLEAALGKYESSEFVDDKVGARLGPPLAAGIRSLIERIDQQNPPIKLLSVIADKNNADLSNARTKLWAIERAVALQLPSDQIRIAILDFVKSASQKHGEPVGRFRSPQLAFLAQIKSKCLEMGVLRPGDLSEIPSLRPLKE